MNVRILLVIVASLLAVAIPASQASARNGSVRADAPAVRTILLRNAALNRLDARVQRYAVFSLDGRRIGTSTEPGSRSVRLRIGR